MIDTPHRLSGELKCRCARPDEIIDTDAPTGEIRACPTCGTSYVNDTGIWRNTLTIGKSKLAKLHAIARVQKITQGMG